MFIKNKTNSRGSYDHQQQFPLKFFFQKKAVNFLHTQLENIQWQKATYLCFKSWRELTGSGRCSVPCIQQPVWRLKGSAETGIFWFEKNESETQSSSQQAACGSFLSFFFLARNKEQRKTKRQKKKKMISAKHLKKILVPSVAHMEACKKW